MKYSFFKKKQSVRKNPIVYPVPSNNGLPTDKLIFSVLFTTATAPSEIVLKIEKLFYNSSLKYT